MDRFHLNKLPAELRNHIAQLVLQHEGGFYITHEDNKHFKLRPNSSHPAHPQALALTCKQLHNEYMQLFYNLNEVRVMCKDARVVDTAAAFLQEIGPQNAAACHLVMLRDIGLCAFDSTEATYGREWAHPDHFRYAFDSTMLNMRQNEVLADVVEQCNTMHLEFRFDPFGSGVRRMKLDCDDMDKSLMRKVDEVYEMPIRDSKGHVVPVQQHFRTSAVKLMLSWAHNLKKARQARHGRFKQIVV